MFEGSRWQWPSFGGGSSGASAQDAPGPSGRGAQTSGARAKGAWPPPPPPPPPPPRGRQGGGPAPAPEWAEALLRGDPELQQLLMDEPGLWAELQRRGGRPLRDVAPPQPPTPAAEGSGGGGGDDAAAFDRQLQQWLDYKRASRTGQRGTPSASDNEIQGIAVMYLVVAVLVIAAASIGWS